MYFLSAFGEELGKGSLSLAPEAATLLEQYRWPGNVRELRNLMERAAVLCTTTSIEADLIRLLLPALRTAAPVETAPESLQLDAANDNKSEAARLLGISERTLWYKLKRYGL